jgi:hypothetical protein
MYPTWMMRFFADTAYKLTGCRGDVVVNVGNGSKSGYKGLFRHTQSTKISKYTRIPTHGLITISPSIRKWWNEDSLSVAIMNFKVFLHEFQHCREYQDRVDFGIFLPMDNDAIRNSSWRQRRKRHDDRPEEKRANAAQERLYIEAEALPEWNQLQDEILEFALMLDRTKEG